MKLSVPIDVWERFTDITVGSLGVAAVLVGVYEGVSAGRWPLLVAGVVLSGYHVGLIHLTARREMSSAKARGAVLTNCRIRHESLVCPPHDCRVAVSIIGDGVPVSTFHSKTYRVEFTEENQDV